MDREAAKSTKVNIFGEELGIKSQASPEYTRQVADYVDKAMKQVGKVTKITDVHKIAILAAMSISDEFFQARDRAGKKGENWEVRIKEVILALQKSREGVGSGDA